MSYHDNILATVCEFLRGKNLIVGNRLRHDLLQSCINSDKLLFENAIKIMSEYDCYTIFKDENTNLLFITSDIEDIGIISVGTYLDKQSYTCVFMKNINFLDMELDDLDWLIEVLIEQIYDCLSSAKYIAIEKELFVICYKYHLYLKLLGIHQDIDKMFISKYEICTRRVLEFIQDNDLYSLINCNNITPVAKGWIE